ncbi:uncharacterized protein [Palaemon carinicauda]|uniref:uncharacterized protein n=1 Tax=Palaemon carinicauda TaxID=392227 RepID=UPI0035B687E5
MLAVWGRGAPTSAVPHPRTSPCCYTCQAYGHLSRECPAKNAEDGRAVAQAHLPRPISEEKKTEAGGDGGDRWPPHDIRSSSQGSGKSDDDGLGRKGTGTFIGTPDLTLAALGSCGVAGKVVGRTLYILMVG